MKEENYETIWGRKNSNHPILTENIIRHLYYRESEITDDAFPSQFENDIMGISK